MQNNTFEEARHKWLGILTHFGVDQNCLVNRHTSCPACGGKDRFRFDDKEGAGTYYCNQCGAGNGFRLLELINGWDFKTAAAKIDELLNITQIKSVRTNNMTNHDKNKQNLNLLYQSTKPFKLESEAGQHLRSRGITNETLKHIEGSTDLRVGKDIPYYDPEVKAVIGKYSAMVGTIKTSGDPSTAHVTYLANGSKAKVPSSRKIMPRTSVPMKGGAVQLGKMGEDGVLGVAEGIETALACRQIFGITTWACISADNMAAFIFPEGLKKIVIFGDNDESFTGHATAYALARRAKAKGLGVGVCIPKYTGQDWNDTIL